MVYRWSLGAMSRARLSSSLSRTSAGTQHPPIRKDQRNCCQIDRLRTTIQAPPAKWHSPPSCQGVSNFKKGSWHRPSPLSGPPGKWTVWRAKQGQRNPLKSYQFRSRDRETPRHPYTSFGFTYGIFKEFLLGHGDILMRVF